MFKNSNNKLNLKLINRKAKVDFISKIIIFLMAIVAIISLLLMFTFILKTSIPAIAHYGFFQIYFTTAFNPSQGQFGIWGPLFITLLTSILATALSWWISVRLAIFLRYRLKKGKKTGQLIIQLLAGIPSIIFGLFAAKSLGVFFSNIFGIQMSRSIFNAIIMLTFMIIPTMTSLVLNQLNNITNDSLEGSMALGNNKTYAIYKVVKKEIHNGIVVAAIVSFGRAIGETMAISLILNGSVSNPLSSGVLGLFTQGWGTLGADIAYWLQSDASTPMLKGALFSVGLSLFILIMAINAVIASASKRKLYASSNTYYFTFKPRKRKTSFQYTIYQISFVVTYPFRLIKYLFRIIGHGLITSAQMIQFYIELWVSWLILPSRGINQTYSNYYKKVSSHPSHKVDHYFKLTLEWISVIFVGIFISWIILDILVKGGKSFSFSNLFTMKKDTLGNSFMYTLLLIEITMAIALPLSIATAIYLTEFSKKSSRSSKTIKFFLDSLSGTPSILFGMFGLIFFLRLMHLAEGNFWKVGSVWAGSLTMVLVVIPTFTRSIEQTFVRVPNSLREGAYSLGAGKWETIRKIVIPASINGIFTGIILSIGRILSETAPVFLTMGIVSSNNFSPGLPGQTLTTRILYYMLYSPLNPNVATGIAYEAALLTLILVLFLTIFITFYKDIINYVKILYYHMFPPKKELIDDNITIGLFGKDGKVIDLHAKK